MKSFFLILLNLGVSYLSGQESKPAFDGHKWEAPYNLPIPKDWTIERFLIPIPFAPQIPYQGVEDIRFSPGWADVNNDQYWTYAFLWYLDGPVETDAKIIGNHLKAYYTGLAAANLQGVEIPSDPVICSIREITADPGDSKTFTGSIEMLDYMQKKRLTLNCSAHLKTCKGNKTILFYELSPKPFSHDNWARLNQLWIDFKCDKTAKKD